MKKKFTLYTVMMLMFVMIATACSTEAPDSISSVSNETQASVTKNSTESGSSASSSETAGGRQGSLKIGVSINALSNIHNQKMYELSEKYIKAAGHEAIMVNANGDPVKQVSDIENLIQQDVDVILLENADIGSVANVVKSAKEKGIPVISVESGWTSDMAAMFALNDFKIASELYMMLLGQIGFKGEVITINHNDHPAIRARRNVQEAILKEYTEVKAVANVTSGFPGTVELAYKGVESALQAHPNVKAIMATFDLEAIGAAQAVKAAGKEKDIIIVGVDGEQEALQMIKDGGPIIATAVGDLDTTMKNAVAVAEKLANGQAVQVFNEIPYQIITKENVDQFLTK